MLVARSLLLHVCLGGAASAGVATALALWTSAQSATLAQRQHNVQLATVAVAGLRPTLVVAAIGGDAQALASLQVVGQTLLRQAGPIISVSLVAAGAQVRGPLLVAGTSIPLTQDEVEPLVESALAQQRCVLAQTDEPVQRLAAVPLVDEQGMSVAVAILEIDAHASVRAPLSIWPLVLALASVGALASCIRRRFALPLAAIEADAGRDAHAALADANVLAQRVRELSHRAKLSDTDLDQRVKVRTREVADHSRAKDEHLANTVHELRTPLTTILASLSILDDGLADTAEERRQFLHNAITATRHLTLLCNDILDTTAFEAGKLRLEVEHTEVTEVLLEAEGLMRPIAIANEIALTVERPLQPHEVNVDRTRVLQVLFNLLGNAVKYSRPHGHVTLRAGADRDGRELLFEVIDDGIGVPAGSRDKLFTKFGRAHGRDTSVAGTGIGLYLCRILVEHMGGRIGYGEHVGGEGSVFWFTLPLHHSMATPPVSPGITMAG